MEEKILLNEENIKLDFNAKYEHTEDYLYSLGVPEKKN